MRLQSRGAGLLTPTQAALPPFDLLRPTSLADARAVLADRPEAVIAAGCTDLVAAIREGLVPSALVSLRNLDELRTVEHDGAALRIGALNTHHDGSAHPVLGATLPELADAWSGIATVRIRFRATVGGNLMARRYRYEMPVILGALDTAMEFSTAAGERHCTVDEFVRRDPAVPEGWALLHTLSVDTASLIAFRYDRSMRPVTTVALAIRRSGDGLRLTAAVGSEYRPAVLVRTDVPVTEVTAIDHADAAHEMAGQLPDRVGDYAGSARYRRRIVEVLLRRQLEATADRRAVA
ncbi:FAD binding domain-containing protein [Pseudonocardia xinjiangensis]|uniref:FAD binding domain-containing protein n=1 Tax=Pseudonocardia xinjiangensis TaxID=75289 RepID=UPI003D8DE686